MNRLSIILLLALAFPTIACSDNNNTGKTVQQPAATPITAQLLIPGLTQPLFVCSPPGDNDRLFIVERTGRIRIYKNGAILSRPFIDLSSKITTSGSEQGLLGLAFHPDYSSNGYFYVNYVDHSGDSHIARFSVSATDPDSAVLSSEKTILFVNQPYSNHNAGMLAFGPNDGYLYFGLGDGGSGGDPQNRAQNLDSLFGKLLRVDVDSGDPYSIPPSNPFVGNSNARPEIWAYGLRNPWRFSFDRQTGDLYIGDVGQNAVEEVDYQPVSSSGGQNYGWRLMEGDRCYNPSSNCDPGGLTPPILTYYHSDPGNPCSITGGYVYRGCAIPDLTGTYFYADYCYGHVWSFKYDGTTLSDWQDRTNELGLNNLSISSFGEDAAGEIYIVDLGGSVYKIVPDGVPSQCNLNCCQGERGNIDQDPQNNIDISDIIYLVDYMFGSGPAPTCTTAANVDGSADGGVDISDLIYLVDYMFGSGPAPGNCPVTLASN